MRGMCLPRAYRAPSILLSQTVFWVLSSISCGTIVESEKEISNTNPAFKILIFCYGSFALILIFKVSFLFTTEFFGVS